MKSINIFIPKQATQEVKYVFHCLLTEFLGITYTLEVTEGLSDYKVEVGHRTLIIENHFFKADRFVNNWSKDAYKKSDIPSIVDNKSVKINKSIFKLLSIFGTSEIEVSNESFRLKSDIIASTFFMLSRWEEYVIKERDSHDRFSAKASLAHKFGFLDRPVVNEYIELLWTILKTMGCTQDRKTRRYTLVPTHDVDTPYLFEKGIENNIRKAGGFIKRGRFAEFFRFMQAKIKNIDPWDTHDLFMDMSEKVGVKSHFFFLPQGQSQHDTKNKLNDNKVKSLIHHIRNRGHFVGLHPTYNSYNDQPLLEDEKQRLEYVLGSEPLTGRQHFLRFETPTTWQLWENIGMKWDSTVGYADASGFRCGIAYPFPVFNILTRTQLNLIEKPLIIMEASLVHYEGLGIKEMEDRVDKLKSEVKRYNGEFVFLYHNSTFLQDEYYNLDGRLLDALYN